MTTEAEWKVIDPVITILDKLIKEAEKKEKEGGGGGGGGGNQPQGGQQGQQSGQAQGLNPPSSPADQSSAPDAKPSMGALHRINRGKSGESWGNLPEREREKILNGATARFPDRYKKLIEQYYKSFQDAPSR